ncbi:transmembrane channel-like protein 6b [Corythoichthys intestinalis]|uniref:transmembrane channel-like protein 6b n=1 Tax=Corythoichthys intestinalis TaxID=161448 RepID=UPI0025A5F61B|nr:transmembrane channel-like protein 6b [Corythoichthys intestinalis]XP_057700750.1 transmembrane channel-like protein 6b [Corythoichthys intestinalis]XP_057700751.1 transmembrane channel-like protein 6b [Corythoichthys intestinalis]XP_057700752.1 transmembrane channel-like protein 6b [Corythoichthys intestinalis]
MARNVNFDLGHPLMEAGLESPADEEGVHDSFHQLLAEQCQTGDLSEAFELQQLQKELDEEGQDYVPGLSSPGLERGERRNHRRRLANQNDERETDPSSGERWSSATLKILSSMPSRTIGRNRGAIISQYYNRTMRLRRRKQSRPSIRDFSRSARPTIRGYGIETDSTDAEVNKRERLVNNLQNLSVSDRIKMLRAMPLSVAEKSELRGLALQKQRRNLSGNQIPCCSRLKYYIIIAARQSWYSWLSFVHSLQLWQVALKRVSGRFGSGVLSYFLFLKTLLFFNLFLFLVIAAFIVLPQAVYPPALPHGRRSFTGLELLTGAGYFSDTVMYYGYYCNYTLRLSCRNESGESYISVSNGTNADCVMKRLPYKMPLAYLLTISTSFFVTCIILVYSMSKSFGRSFRIDKSYSILAMKAFCSWDFKVIKKSSVKLMSENICIQLKELLAEVNHKRSKNSLCQNLWRVAVHFFSWTICVASTTACVLAIYYFSEYIHRNLQQSSRSLSKDPLLHEASLLALPVVVSCINVLLPLMFNLAAWMEDYESPSVRTYVAIGRNLMLKVSVLGVLCYHWLGRVAADPSSIGLKCWESFVGQELYRFLLMDFIFTLLNSLFGEFLWRLFSEKVLKKKRKPVFDIAKNVLDLIYGQTLAWLGLLFTPLLPAVQILKLLLLFYIKKSSVMMNCQAPSRPYRVSQMTTIFITLLCFPSFLGASVCVTYSMWSITPSSSCGPFRELKTMFQAGKRWVEDIEKENSNLSMLAKAHLYLVENPLFLFLGAGIFLIVIYFHSQVVDGQRKIINLLQEQIENEGEDKKFLITRLQSIHEQKRTPGRRLTSQDSAC